MVFWKEAEDPGGSRVNPAHDAAVVTLPCSLRQRKWEKTHVGRGSGLEATSSVLLREGQGPDVQFWGQGEVAQY